MLDDSIRIGLVFIQLLAAAIWVGRTIFVASALQELAPGAPSTTVAAQGQRLVKLARLNLLLTLAIVALGTMLFRGVPG